MNQNASVRTLVVCSALFALWALFAPGAGVQAGARPPEPPPSLRVDPLLLAQAAEVWSVVAQAENPVWPGWNAASTPMLFYLPGAQDVLVNHPQPPEGFRPYSGPAGLPGAKIHVRDGKTIFEFDGQNTVTDVAGTPTLVVADTLSNRRNQVRSWLEDPRPAAKKSADLGWDQLQGDPYSSLCMIAHEAFHAFQQRRAPNKGGSEEALTRYPTIAAANTLGFALEGELLAAALRAADSRAADQATVRSLAHRWLAVRRERRKSISAEAADYEDRMEYLEGLAKYVEYRLLEVLEGRSAAPSMAWAQGFHGYADLKPQREQLIRTLEKMMSGAANVNNDPYGASPLRMRLYYSGMAIGVLLDRFSPGWKQRIFDPKATLTDLAADALKPTDAELAAALAAVRGQPGYAALAAQKEQLERDGAAATQKMLQEIEAGPESVLVLDYSALEDVRPGMAFTPFGILRVDDQRTIYRLIPITARVANTTLRQTQPTPLLHDRAGRRFLCRLQEPVAKEKAEALFNAQAGGSEPSPLKGVALPGVKLDGGRAVLHVRDRFLEVKLAPPPGKPAAP